ncbi:hypothetical protein BWQ96_05479 [Gracilariopsis chorda]|uniref:Uncharacterized protein n=1 Tax=Gracilariopsis chorda TaxID=448386 RepID=A0A2V3IRS8_9FLOR|nr:hypothetical protein BWQ96_05479 [Gracilariopsis chorda]|eukprot:PXF44809.1 hypothetical protein BWQ96_05479 [Gracilariopsis chorda]
MKVEARRDSYSSDGVGGCSTMFTEEQDDSDILLEYIKDGSVAQFVKSYEGTADDVKLKGQHRKLRDALIEHIWNMNTQAT